MKENVMRVGVGNAKWESPMSPVRGRVEEMNVEVAVPGLDGTMSVRLFRVTIQDESRTFKTLNEAESWRAERSRTIAAAQEAVHARAELRRLIQHYASSLTLTANEYDGNARSPKAVAGLRNAVESLIEICDHMDRGDA